MSVIQGDLQSQKVDFQVKFLKNIIFNKYLFFMWFLIESPFVVIHLVIPKTS